MINVSYALTTRPRRLYSYVVSAVFAQHRCGRLQFVLLVLLFTVINIVLPQFILPRVAPVGRILFMYSRINNQSMAMKMFIIRSKHFLQKVASVTLVCSWMRSMR